MKKLILIALFFLPLSFARGSHVRVAHLLIDSIEVPEYSNGWGDPFVKKLAKQDKKKRNLWKVFGSNDYIIHLRDYIIEVHKKGDKIIYKYDPENSPGNLWVWGFNVRVEVSHLFSPAHGYP